MPVALSSTATADVALRTQCHTPLKGGERERARERQRERQREAGARGAHGIAPHPPAPVGTRRRSASWSPHAPPDSRRSRLLGPARQSGCRCRRFPPVQRQRALPLPRWRTSLSSKSHKESPGVREPQQGTETATERERDRQRQRETRRETQRETDPGAARRGRALASSRAAQRRTRAPRPAAAFRPLSVPAPAPVLARTSARHSLAARGPQTPELQARCTGVEASRGKEGSLRHRRQNLRNLHDTVVKSTWALLC